MPGDVAACDNAGGAPIGAGFGGRRDHMGVEFTTIGMTATVGQGAGSQRSGFTSPQYGPPLPTKMLRPHPGKRDERHTKPAAENTTKPYKYSGVLYF